MPPVASALLSSAHMETLRQHGEERSAAVGDVLFEVGDERYPLIAILEGEAAIYDAAGDEIVRHGAFGFLGELNLLSGQTVYLTAVVTAPLRYIAVEREALRPLLAEEGSLADVLLSAFITRREVLQGRQGIGVEIIGPRSSPATREIVGYVRDARLPHSWRDTDEADEDEARQLIAELSEDQLPLVRLPGGADLRRPTRGQVWRGLGIGLKLKAREEVDLLIVGGGPAGLGAAVYGASEGLDTLVVEGTVLGGQAGSSRRIENYLGFPAGIGGAELTTRAVSQAHKFGARMATPYKAVGLEPGGERHVVHLEDHRQIAARAVVLATGASYRRLPVPDIEVFEGISVFYAAGPAEAQQCAAARVAVIGGGNSAAQAAIWLARSGALVTLLHRRRSLSETMSDYLIRDLDRYGVTVRDQSEIAALHGTDGQLEAVTLRDDERLPLAYLFLFLGAAPCTDWIGDSLATDEHGFILTGVDAESTALLETSVPGIYAAGDARAGSTKRVASAVGEGAMVVRLVHEGLLRTRA